MCFGFGVNMTALAKHKVILMNPPIFLTTALGLLLGADLPFRCQIHTGLRDALRRKDQKSPRRLLTPSK